uniref:Uncharacterized protein n=1 Tax=Arion vulgaris TaxID=1028688 RepID=A0A0B6ZXA9_9EUPU
MADNTQDRHKNNDLQDPNGHQETTNKEEQTPKRSKTSKKKDRSNKIYRAPPTPPRTTLLLMEKSFVLDCNATSNISQDYSNTNPKLGPVIPPYNSQRDKHVGNYFRFYGVHRTLKKTGQHNENATSIEGSACDNFHQKGPGFKYLSLRNLCGAGHSQETIDGHAQFMQGIRGVSGYNGLYGFRRNTPWLRKTPTPFGTPAIMKKTMK